MRSVKERLVSLLCDHTCPGEDCCSHHDCNDCLADHLIANGVTIAEDKNVLTNAVRCAQCALAEKHKTASFSYICRNEKSPCYCRTAYADFGCTYGERKTDE